MRGEGPQQVVTDKAIFDFANPGREIQLVSPYPGVTTADVREAVGWDLRMAHSVGETPAPSEEELALVRSIGPGTTNA